jgi:site-specific DNA-methyltransferase (adenine-specific)
MILCDLPYGVTQNKWDSVLPLDLLWKEYQRIIKDNGAILLFGQEPFSSTLRMSNLKHFKYDWIWEKSHTRGFLNAWKQPLRKTEIISVFYKKQCLYNPQITDKPVENIRPHTTRTKQKGNYGDFKLDTHKLPADKSMPVNIIRFNTVQKGKHPTQKPIDLCEYLIKTYTDTGETVLDNCLGSGTTAVACTNTDRNFIGIEKEWDYCEIANERIKEAQELKV